MSASPLVNLLDIGTWKALELCPRCGGAGIETEGLNRGRWCRKCRGKGRLPVVPPEAKP